MIKKERKLTNKEKLLIVIYEMSLKQQGTLKYEDISVRAFKNYPNDFQLRGYPEYLDTEHTSKRIYDLRRAGLINVHSKFITLTEKGRTYVKQLIKGQTGFSEKSKQKLSRDILNEINRIKNTDAFQLFVNGKGDQIVDTDFFVYLGATVKIERTDFKARIKTIEDIIAAIEIMKEYKIIVDLHNYLFEKFKEIIKTKLSTGFPRRRS